MPLPGYRSITVSEEVALKFDEIYYKNIIKLRRMGVRNKQQFLKLMMQQFEKELSQNLETSARALQENRKAKDEDIE
ncbi:MAG: hypothetical protein JRM78_04365 [Nitrososphaerota archaeon]|nr:hypothetical protein [Nitrososphaerota archaeon]